jgi:hypothetical protein
MKIYFNRRPAQGPWGGGSKVLSSIVSECIARGHQVFFEEEINKNQKFDVLFCMDPRANHAVSYYDLIMHKSNYGSKIFQRVGDLGTHGKPDLYEIVKKTSEISDVLIFPSEWAKNYLNPENKNSFVICNASMHDFNLVEKKQKQFSNIVKIVSHHWSDNPNKGFEIYEKLDLYCRSSNKFDFTYIGRKPTSVSFKSHIPPQDVNGLLDELPKHDVYITASKFEAGANHVLEAISIGLPVLYHKDGGSINEYAQSKGIEYSGFDHLVWILENQIEELQKISNLEKEKRTSKDMAKEYVDLFEVLYEN